MTKIISYLFGVNVFISCLALIISYLPIITVSLNDSSKSYSPTNFLVIGKLPVISVLISSGIIIFNLPIIYALVSDDNRDMIFRIDRLSMYHALMESFFSIGFFLYILGLILLISRPIVGNINLYDLYFYCLAQGCKIDYSINKISILIYLTSIILILTIYTSFSLACYSVNKAYFSVLTLNLLIISGVTAFLFSTTIVPIFISISKILIGITSFLTGINIINVIKIIKDVYKAK